MGVITTMTPIVSLQEQHLGMRVIPESEKHAANLPCK